MTPAETYMTIEAHIWKQEQDQKLRAWEVWHIAALTRAKRMPPLSALTKAPDGKQLSPDEKLERQREFEDLTNKYGKAK